MTDEEYQIRRKYENRNLMQELEWVSHYPPSRMSNQDKAFIRWLAMTAYDKINELEQTSVPVHDIELILDEVAKPQWIPVKESYPETNDEVLVTYIVNGDKSKRYVEAASWYDGDDGFWVSAWDEYRVPGTRIEIVAWMPFPKPYKPTEDEI